MTPPLAHRSQAGFTLLEMVIGITLLGFILVLLYGGLRLASQGWDAGEKRIEAGSRQNVVIEFLRRQLVMTHPLRWRREDTTEALAFEGERDAVRFAAPIPARLGTGGIHLVELTSSRADEGVELRMRWRLPDPEDSGFEFDDDSEQVVLARALEQIEWSYFGADSDLVEPAWQDQWHSETRLPSLLRMRLTGKDGERWPDIVVAIAQSAATACVWDDFNKRCR